MEKTDQYDFGIDMDLFNHRLAVTLDYYYRYTDKLLYLIVLRVIIPVTYSNGKTPIVSVTKAWSWILNGTCYDVSILIGI